MDRPPLLVGRLAPSPTGAQHIGNARTYLLAWLSIRSRGGRVILRMEDIDSPRVKRGAAQQAIDDLRWLGLEWDEGPDVGGPHAPYVQTERLDLYRQALDQLKDAERVYPCTCTRSDVEAAASAPHAGQEGPIYPGTCAGRSVADAGTLARSVKEGAAVPPLAWRLRTTNAPRRFDDLIAGTKSCSVASDLGDFVVAKADGSPAYQLAVVVDDHAMEITEVFRGDDLVPSAFRQLELYDFFGWPPPQFAHVPLVVGPDARRLAKRHGDTRLSMLREAGVSPQRLVGLLAWSCRFIERQEPISLQELLSVFNTTKLPRQSWTFTDQHLQWLVAASKAPSHEGHKD